MNETKQLMSRVVHTRISLYCCGTACKNTGANIFVSIFNYTHIHTTLMTFLNMFSCLCYSSQSTSSCNITVLFCSIYKQYCLSRGFDYVFLSSFSNCFVSFKKNAKNIVKNYCIVSIKRFNCSFNSEQYLIEQINPRSRQVQTSTVVDTNQIDTAACKPFTAKKKTKF